ncbi:hypothetical protein RPB_4500 [Rhodopseudomonas palustris HaA2]|uniref:Uncharacterized protein n=1 Tax=Rhodopseudomonas palustris (strain HaA2) TaxID=316058 RepID=Q2IRH7_RHOP2|nr:hypothetical protein RPB_4500 [Rhodopseudomonas palustris HaA2]
MLLQTLSLDQLLCQAEADRYPKWNTMCLLRSLGGTTLNAVLLDPDQIIPSTPGVRGVLQHFSQVIGNSRVMIRTDRRKENASYVRGGNSYSLDQAAEYTTQLLTAGRGVIALEPTNRLTNLTTINLGVDGDGCWRAEILGPGFDASDLQRGDTIPEFVCYGLPMHPAQYSHIRAHNFSIEVLSTVSMEERTKSRLHSICQNVLPSFGADFRGSADSEARTRTWLLQHGYTSALRPRFASFPFNAFKRVFEMGQLVFQYRFNRQKTSAFVLSSGILADYRLVYWDIADASNKWAA